MIGLPTETDEDILAIVSMLNDLGKIVRKYQGRRINVTISPFSPKPVTPFQWENQDSGPEISRKLRLIRENLRSRSIVIKEPNPFLSLLECRLARSDRRASSVILKAWKKGSRLDGWTENFRRDIWEEVFRDKGIHLWEGGGGIEQGDPLPWEHLHYGVDQEYLACEREKAYQAETTPDCRDNCHGCGPYAVFCKSAKKEITTKHIPAGIPENKKKPEAVLYGRRKKPAQPKQQAPAVGYRMRVKYSKTGSARYTGHLDLIRIFDRALRRADIPVAYSMGFHPHPKVSFGHPLPLGYESLAEYVDITLSESFPGLEASLRKGFPYGFDVRTVKAVSEHASSLVSIITRAEYFVKCDIDEQTAAAIKKILDSESIRIVRSSKKGDRIVDVRPGIYNLAIDSKKGGFSMELSLEAEQSAKPLEVLSLIFPAHVYPEIVRTEQFVIRNGEKLTPLEVMW
jgi:radical SAM-linked protein